MLTMIVKESMVCSWRRQDERERERERGGKDNTFIVAYLVPNYTFFSSFSDTEYTLCCTYVFCKYCNEQTRQSAERWDKNERSSKGFQETPPTDFNNNKRTIYDDEEKVIFRFCRALHAYTHVRIVSKGWSWTKYNGRAWKKGREKYRMEKSSLANGAPLRFVWFIWLTVWPTNRNEPFGHTVFANLIDLRFSYAYF